METSILACTPYPEYIIGSEDSHLDLRFSTQFNTSFMLPVKLYVREVFEAIILTSLLKSLSIDLAM
jgi:hypothetical protein